MFDPLSLHTDSALTHASYSPLISTYCTLRGEIPTGISDTHSLVIFSIEFCDEFHGIWRNDLQRRGCPATAHVRLHRQVHLVEVDKPVRLLWTVPGGGGGIK